MTSFLQISIFCLVEHLFLSYDFNTIFHQININSKMPLFYMQLRRTTNNSVIIKHYMNFYIYLNFKNDII